MGFERVSMNITKLVTGLRLGTHTPQGAVAIRAWRAVSQGGLRALDLQRWGARLCAVRVILEIESRDALLTIEMSRRLLDRST